MTLADVLARTVADSKDEPAWKAHRFGRVGASNAAAFSKPQSAPGYAAAMLTDWAGGNEFTDRGRFWEPHALAAYGFEQNTLMFRSIEEDGYVATPDGIRENETGLELAETKATKHAKIAPDGAPVPPRTHYRQMQWQMMVAGPDALVCDYIVVPLGPQGQLLRTMPLRARIPRNEDAIAALLAIAVPVLSAIRAAHRLSQEA